MSEPDIGDAGIMYGEWQNAKKRAETAEAERDKLRGQVGAMREGFNRIRIQQELGRYCPSIITEMLTSSAAGAPEAAVIKAVLLEYESCKRAGLNSCESEDGPGCAMWPICRHVDAMQKA